MQDDQNTNKFTSIPIIYFGENHQLILDDVVLKQILLGDDLKDRNVVVVSVMGAFQVGKSFLLNFFFF